MHHESKASYQQLGTRHSLAYTAKDQFDSSATRRCKPENTYTYNSVCVKCAKWSKCQ